ncbi:eCIS core domain-containing protein [Streptomyces chartreusis]
MTTGPAPEAVLRRCGDRPCDCADDERPATTLRRSATTPVPATEVPPVVHEVLRSPGHPLPSDTRAFFEPRFGQDFSGVRVHTDVTAAESARAVQAKAYTVGSDIVFAHGTYAPESPVGRGLLAHELAHTVQQQAVGDDLHGLTVGSPRATAEHEAEAASRDFAATPLTVGTSHPVIMRQMQSVGTREARATAGELTMGFAYRAEEGWGFLSGPGGSAGHRWNEPGFDGVAFRTQGPFEIHILDNKSWARTGNVGSSSALTDNLLKNLDDLIGTVADSKFDDIPRIAQVRTSLSKARSAVAGHGPLPKDIHLVVTSFGGRSTGVTAALAARGVEFTGTAGPGRVQGGTGGSPAVRGGVGESVRPVQTPSMRSTRSGQAAVAQVASAEAKALAAEAGATLRGQLRNLRAVRVFNSALHVLNAIQSLQLLNDAMDMARGGLSGEGFILRREIAESRQLENDLEEQRRGYQLFSESLTELQPQLLRVWIGREPAVAVGTMTDLASVRNRIIAVQHLLVQRLNRVREVLREVEAKEAANEAILKSPATAGVLGAILGSAQLSQHFGAWQDFERIHGHLRRGVESMEFLQSAMQADVEFLDAWWGAMFREVLRAGLSAKVDLPVPLMGDVTFGPVGGAQ